MTESDIIYRCEVCEKTYVTNKGTSAPTENRCSEGICHTRKIVYDRSKLKEKKEEILQCQLCKSNTIKLVGNVIHCYNCRAVSINNRPKKDTMFISKRDFK